jgi:hypothetical protein
VINEIRKRNYDALLLQFRQKEIQAGEPDRGFLNRFGAFVGISPRYLSHINNARKQIGSDTARKIELAFKLPHGWMDQDHLGGVSASDRTEREFVELALRLFRESPLEAQSMLLKYAGDRMLALSVAKKGKKAVA